MGKDWIPRQDAKLLSYARHFSLRINEDPAAYGLTTEEATEFAVLNDAWSQAYIIAKNNSTRTPAAIVAKDGAREALVTMLRSLGMFIQRRPQTTDDQRMQLGLRIYATNHTPITPPKTAPGLAILSILGQSVRLELRDVQAQSRRGKPDGVAGATIYSLNADTASRDMRDWNTLGNFTRPYVRLNFPSALYSAGSKVFLAACWYNPRGQHGPIGNTISFHLAGGLASFKVA